MINKHEEHVFRRRALLFDVKKSDRPLEWVIGGAADQIEFARSTAWRS
jgi:hypothetical protein